MEIVNRKHEMVTYFDFKFSVCKVSFCFLFINNFHDDFQDGFQDGFQGMVFVIFSCSCDSMSGSRIWPWNFALICFYN